MGRTYVCGLNCGLWRDGGSGGHSGACGDEFFEYLAGQAADCGAAGALDGA